MGGINISEIAPTKKAENSKIRKRRVKLSELSSNYAAKSGSKVVAKPQESGSKVVAQPQESGSKVVAQPQESSSKVVAKSGSKKQQNNESGSKVVAQPVAKVVAKPQESSSKVVAKSVFLELSGLQRKLLTILYFSCRKNGEKVTSPFSIQHLAESLKTTIGTTKNTIHRLVSKGLIEKYEFKNGRGGWTKYKLRNKTYNDMLQNESDSKLVAQSQESSSKVVAQLVAQPVAKPSSSSSSILLNTITTSEGNSQKNDWVKHIQTPENLKSLGFGIGHIKQLKEKFSLTHEQIQNGLEAFSFDLAQGELERLKARGIQNIIGYFFGAMKTGGYNSISEDFVCAEDFAEQEMLERLEKKQKERNERKEKLESLLFEEWLETKSESEILEIERPVSGYLDIIHRAGLKDYFLKNELEIFKNEFHPSR